MSRGDANALMVLDYLATTGPKGIGEIMESLRIGRMLARDIIKRNTLRGIIVVDKTSRPNKYSAPENWQELIRKHFADRTKMRRENGSQLQAKYPGRTKQQLGPDRRAGIQELMAACMAVKPDVRTKWVFQPQWAANPHQQARQDVGLAA